MGKYEGEVNPGNAAPAEAVDWGCEGEGDWGKSPSTKATAPEPEDKGNGEGEGESGGDTGNSGVTMTVALATEDAVVTAGNTPPHRRHDWKSHRQRIGTSIPRLARPQTHRYLSSPRTLRQR